jgi:hypothetical protein
MSLEAVLIAANSSLRRDIWRTVIEAFGLSNDDSALIFQAVSYTVATLPAAATYPRAIVYVSNEAGGATIAFSDGTAWRRVQDRAVVS